MAGNHTLENLGINQSRLPSHIAIIMDGNGRWAAQNGMHRAFGHQEGARRVREIVETSSSLGISVLTLYAFSAENWSRPEYEVEALFNLLTEYLRSEINQLNKQNVRLTTIGERNRLPTECIKMLDHCEKVTHNNTGLRLVLALSYGGRSDLVKCCKNIAREVAIGNLSWQDIDEKIVTANLATWDLPSPDLLIRTSGEERLSNFLLWEVAYSEFLFYKANWPDFTKDHLIDAVRQYSKRERRFGSLEQNPTGPMNPPPDTGLS